MPGMKDTTGKDNYELVPLHFVNRILNTPVEPLPLEETQGVLLFCITEDFYANTLCRLFKALFECSSASLYHLNQAYKIGAIKYEPHNWQKGIPTYKLLMACLRHLHAAECAKLSGEVTDPSEALNIADYIGTDIQPASHYGHVMWGVLTCLWYSEYQEDYVQMAPADAQYEENK